jgi:hypothetical protein
MQHPLHKRNPNPNPNLPTITTITLTRTNNATNNPNPLTAPSTETPNHRQTEEPKHQPPEHQLIHSTITRAILIRQQRARTSVSAKIRTQPTPPNNRVTLTPERSVDSYIKPADGRFCSDSKQRKHLSPRTNPNPSQSVKRSINPNPNGTHPSNQQTEN